MRMEVKRGFFETREQVYDDLKKTGFWPTTFVSDAAPTLPVHWHEGEIHGYVIEGTPWVLDGETQERVELRPGDKLILPPGSLHAEGESNETVVYIVALPEPGPLLEALAMHDPEDPKRPA